LGQKEAKEIKMSEKKYRIPFQEVKLLPQADSISTNLGPSGQVIEVELNCTLDSIPKKGTHVFVFAQGNDITVVCGEVVGYREIKPDPKIKQEVFSILQMRGRYVSFNW
jgi:hypothetical protein